MRSRVRCFTPEIENCQLPFHANGRAGNQRYPRRMTGTVHRRSRGKVVTTIHHAGDGHGCRHRACVFHNAQQLPSATGNSSDSRLASARHRQGTNLNARIDGTHRIRRAVAPWRARCPAVRVGNLPLQVGQVDGGHDRQSSGAPIRQPPPDKDTPGCPNPPAPITTHMRGAQLFLPGNIKTRQHDLPAVTQ
jgi:hypothetical protein